MATPARIMATAATPAATMTTTGPVSKGPEGPDAGGAGAIWAPQANEMFQAHQPRPR